MNKKIGSLSVCGAAMFLSLLVSSAFGYEKEIEELSAQMAEKIAGKGKNTVAVVDFTDLEGNVTQLDKFIAEEFSVALAGAGKGFRVIDRTRLKSIIKENKLAATGLIDPATASKLGKIAGVDALVTGTLTPFGDNVRLTVKVLDSNTADIIDSAKSNFAKTQAIDELLGKEISSETAANASSGGTKQVSDKKAVMSQIVRDVFFEVKQCKISARMLKCDLSATNNKNDKVLTIHSRWTEEYNTRMFDNSSNEYIVMKIEFANKKSDNRMVEHMLISGVATKLALVFEGVHDSVNMLSLLELSCEDNEDRFKVQFRNIPVSR